MQNVPSQFVRPIGWDIIWTLLTCGLYNLHVQNEQMKALNSMLNQEKYQFWPWAAFTLVTCGIYHVYHEYRMMLDLSLVTKKGGSTEAFMCAAFAAFGLHIIADCIQQTYINEYYGSTKL